MSPSGTSHRSQNTFARRESNVANERNERVEESDAAAVEVPSRDLPVEVEPEKKIEQPAAALPEKRNFENDFQKIRRGVYRVESKDLTGAVMYDGYNSPCGARYPHLHVATKYFFFSSPSLSLPSLLGKKRGIESYQLLSIPRILLSKPTSL